MPAAPRPEAGVPVEVSRPGGRLSSDPAAPRTEALPAAGPAPIAAVDLPGLIPAPLWRQLARLQLLLPLLRQSVVADAVAAVTLSDEERTAAQRAWGSQHGIRSAEDLAAHLRGHDLREADVLWQAELPQRLQRHCQDHFGHRAEQRFLARKNQLDQVIYSLLRVEDGALARELYLQIAEGESDFAELAGRYAQGPERATRGVVGPVPLLQAHPVLAELLRTSRPGQLHPPLQIESWWLVVRLEALKSASFDEAMQRRMERELFEEWVEEQVRELIARGVAA